MSKDNRNIIWFENLSRGDVGLVGGKNSSLGEMVSQLSKAGIKVPAGFATTADAYRAYMEANQLNDMIAETLAREAAGKITLQQAGQTIRTAIIAGDWPQDISDSILEAYRGLGTRSETPDLPVAVRSSATAEDLPDASFAGQQETYLNVRGEAALLNI